MTTTVLRIVMGPQSSFGLAVGDDSCLVLTTEYSLGKVAVGVPELAASQ